MAPVQQSGHGAGPIQVSDQGFVNEVAALVIAPALSRLAQEPELTLLRGSPEQEAFSDRAVYARRRGRESRKRRAHYKESQLLDVETHGLLLGGGRVDLGVERQRGAQAVQDGVDRGVAGRHGRLRKDGGRRRGRELADLRCQTLRGANQLPEKPVNGVELALDVGYRIGRCCGCCAYGFAHADLLVGAGWWTDALLDGVLERVPGAPLQLLEVECADLPDVAGGKVTLGLGDQAGDVRVRELRVRRVAVAEARGGRLDLTGELRRELDEDAGLDGAATLLRGSGCCSFVALCGQSFPCHASSLAAQPRLVTLVLSRRTRQLVEFAHQRPRDVVDLM